jgi:hypothetical protein
MPATSALLISEPALFADSQSALSLVAAAGWVGSAAAVVVVAAAAGAVVDPAVVAGSSPAHAARVIREAQISAAEVTRKLFIGGHGSR